MASGDQIKALLKSHLEGDDDRFFAVAIQVAAHEARLGHGKLAQELRAMVDEAKGRAGTVRPVPIGRPRGELPRRRDRSGGLEFRAVAVMACDDEVLPLQERIENVADDADLEEVYDTERHLLYVACTRARDHLIITGVEPASEFLDDLLVQSSGAAA